MFIFGCVESRRMEADAQMLRASTSRGYAMDVKCFILHVTTSSSTSVQHAKTFAKNTFFANILA